MLLGFDDLEVLGIWISTALQYGVDFRDFRDSVVDVYQDHIFAVPRSRLDSEAPLEGGIVARRRRSTCPFEIRTEDENRP